MILQKLEPKIAPPSINVYDFESETSPNKLRKPDLTGYAKELGRRAPLVVVGNLRLDPSDVVSMEVYQSGMIPTIHLSFVDSTGSFTSISYPKTNPIVTAYVAKTHQKLKSFCQTFLITDIHSMRLDEFSVRYDLYGELYVPNLNGNFIKSYSNKSSAETLLTVAKELGLGFATNDDSTNDKMTWINPNLNYKSFIQSVVDRAYKNDSTFFDCFIDRYYVLNFVNVEKQFRRGGDIDLGFSGNYQGYLELDRTNTSVDSTSTEEPVPLVLTNSTAIPYGSELRITSYTLTGENGAILKNSGFRKRVFVYKHGQQNPVLNWFVEPLSNQDDPAGPVHQTPVLADFVNTETVKWMGSDYGNTHLNYKFAKLINHHNKLETEKNTLIVELNGFNQAVVRGGKVEVRIYGTRMKAINDNRLQEDKQKVNDDTRNNDIGNIRPSNPEILDRYLSDSYYVKEIEYMYDGFNHEIPFKTKLVLSRRSWFPEPLLENNL